MVAKLSNTREFGFSTLLLDELSEGVVSWPVHVVTMALMSNFSVLKITKGNKKR